MNNTRRLASEHGPRYTSSPLVQGTRLFDVPSEPRNVKPSTSRNNNDEKREQPRWNVTSLRPVPALYPLEKTCIIVDENMPLSVLCARMSNFLRVNSVCCTFHKHSVDCVTMGGLKFSIHLWKARNGVIVEMQRRQGCAIQMQHYRHGLVEAIMTSGEPPVVSCQRLNVHTVDCSIFHEMERKSNECLSALKIAKRLLESDHYDQNRLGMESLVAMTNPATVLKKDANFVSRALVCGDAPLGDCLRDAVVRYFHNIERNDDSSVESLGYDSDDDDEEEEYLQGPHFGAMHNLALRVMANALQVVSELEDGRSVAELSMVDLESPFWDAFCNSLVYNIQEAHFRPREAALSAQCLNVLTRLAPILCECPIMDRLVPALPEANACGKACSLLLERESEQLMSTLAEAG